ncbi:MAG TPA: recombination mediator RecR [Phycisphaerae bacterium]|nr:recombination protein RecR [Phycisphaerae bacterium]HPM22782.1 recombination mediator RecR [Phycisphaerae bacterium]HQL53071.1 recombination mediator RecR [Phycisphaerae bacterium]
MSESTLTGPLQRLMDELKKLPGIGARSAERIAFHLLKAERDEALALAKAIVATKDEIRPCARCYNLADAELCHICADGRRDQAQIVVVEQPKDLLSLEATGLITGVYHVLMGHIAPLEGLGPADLTIDALVQRVRAGDVREVILATNPTLEGDATALHITSVLADTGVNVTRLARGIAPGSQIEFANRAMLEAAIRGRKQA